MDDKNINHNGAEAESINESTEEIHTAEQGATPSPDVSGTDKQGNQSVTQREAEYAFKWSYADKEYASKKQKKQKNGALIYGIIMTAAFLLCFGILIAVLLIDGIANITETKIIENDRTVYIRDIDEDSGILTVPEIASKVKPSTVSLSVATVTSKSVGTGIIMTEDGYIATNAHVINGAVEIKVVLSDGTEKTAEVIGKDAAADLAVIKIDGSGYAKAEFGSSDELLVGETVVAIGTPTSLELAGTVTSGIISALNREIKMYDNAGGVNKTMTVIQTTAALNSGNSGGPLINDRGQVIGVNTMKITDSSATEAIGFAIPIDGALVILNKIIETGADVEGIENEIVKKRAVIGISGGPVSQIDGAPVAGFYVKEVSEGYDAENYLKEGDIIIGINGFEVLATEDISEVINELKVGDTVELKVYRKGTISDFTVALGEEN